MCRRNQTSNKQMILTIVVERAVAAAAPVTPHLGMRSKFNPMVINTMTSELTMLTFGWSVISRILAPTPVQVYASVPIARIIMLVAPAVKSSPKIDNSGFANRNEVKKTGRLNITNQRVVAW